MEQISIDKYFEDHYKISFSDLERKRFLNFFSTSNIDETNCKVEVQSSIENLINNAIVTRHFNLSRLHTDITVEDIVFSLTPMHWGSETNISISYPRMRGTLSIVDPIVQDIDQNIVIVRVLEYDNTTNQFTERYVILVYNKKLDVKGGIIFEDIKDEEVKEDG